MYPKPDDRPAIGVLQWIQYQLDNCASIDEVIVTDKTVRIISKGTPLHYLVADSKGNAATIEFLNGKMVVHKGADLSMPVLTNDTYERSVTSHANGTAANNSLQRFSTACKMIQEYKADQQGKTLIDQSFSILDKVAQGDYTKWSIVYDITDKKIYFKTEKFKQVRIVNFSSFNFSCDAASKTMDMNTAEHGDISKYFKDYSNHTNQLVFEKTVKQSSSRIELKQEEKQAVVAYPDAIHCK
jgi:penicillin V acylase-like amidase (Ntn superfamily)